MRRRWCRGRRFILPLGLVAIGAVGASGCDDVSEYTTGPDERYCGSVVPGPFVRQGFGPGVRMRMSFDASRLGSEPGVISTDYGTFGEAPLRAIPQLQNDPLSTLQFGEGRSRNLLLGLLPADGQTAVAVVSLMENGDVEVRILRGAPPPTGVSAVPVHEAGSLFAVFKLSKQRGLCGF